MDQSLRLAEAGNAFLVPVAGHIQHFHCVVTERSDEQSMTFDVHREVIDTAFDARHGDRGNELERRFASSLRRDKRARERAPGEDPPAERHYRYACGFHVCTSSFPSLHQVYNASYITMPCASISWSSLKLRESPSEMAARPGACGASSSLAVSAPRTMVASSFSAGSVSW